MIDGQTLINHTVALALAAIVIACRPAQVAEVPEPAAQEVTTPASKREPYWKSMFPKWEMPLAPFRLIGDIYYVGTQGLAFFFIPTDDGHIIIDGGLPGQGEYIVRQIEALGYDPLDVKLLLNTHAHVDHSGGFAELKQLTGARLMSSLGDKLAIERGVYIGSEDIEDFRMPPVMVDEILRDGKPVELGGVTLKPVLTPGHSPGCTSWWITVEEEGEPYDVLIFCSATVAANRLSGPPQYPGIVEAYKRTFEITKDWQPDVFLANHPEFFQLERRLERYDEEGPMVFVDQAAFQRHIQPKRRAFESKLAELTPQ